MKMRLIILLFPVILVIGLSLAVMQHPADAAPPQAPSASTAKAVTAPVVGSAGAMAIPDTTLAINSAKPMSERVVHYEIDAKYDAVKHIVDATEVLTYHNLTGQALDHFPFHLYQNAF